jgi:hypothetical protein
VICEELEDGTVNVDEAARLAMRCLFREWRSQIAAGHLTRDGLTRLRVRLASREFPAGDTERELMAIEVNDALAAMLGVPADSLPGAEPVPDTPQVLIEPPTPPTPPY